MECNRQIVSGAEYRWRALLSVGFVESWLRLLKKSRHRSADAFGRIGEEAFNLRQRIQLCT